MSYATTIAALIVNGAGCEETLAGEYATYSQEQRRFVDLMLMRDDVPHYVFLAKNTTLTAADNGKTFLLNDPAGFTVTLPAAALGFHVKFIVKVATSAGYTITSPGSDLCGRVVSAAGGVEDSDSTAGLDSVTLTTAVVAGDQVEIFHSGTICYSISKCAVTGAITLD